MKRSLVATLVAALTLLAPASLAVAAETPAAMCDALPTGRDFGQHVAMHAQLGMLGHGMDPGMHQGFSICVPR